MSKPTLSKQDASPRAIALLEALHEPYSNEERLWIIEEALRESKPHWPHRVCPGGYGFCLDELGLR